MEYKKPFVMGIDAGTGSVRVGLFDSRGTPVIFSTREYSTRFPQPGWAEQDPEEWWRSLIDAAAEAVKKSGVSAEDIMAVGVDGTSSTVVCLDKDLNHLRNAILWMDNRSAQQAKRIFESNDPALKRSSAGVSAEWMIPKILWLKENEPDLFERTCCFMEAADWINYRLTGELCLSINHITHRWFYNGREGGWPDAFYRAIGLENITEKFPKNILELGRVIGTLSPEAARATGLTSHTVVAEGGCDAYIGTLGLNVTKPGRAALITGSSHLILLVTTGNINVKGLFGAHPDCVIPGLCVLEGGQVSSGSIITWFKDNFTKSEEIEAEKRGIGHYDLLNEKAREVPVGSEGLIVLDYWQGNRNPYTDYQVQGAIWGLTLKHKSGNIFRAIMEGVAYGTENILRIMSENGLKVDALYIGGGVVKSDLWMKVHADVSNIPIHVTEFSEATVLGSAVCAAVGAGIYNELAEAAENMVRIKRVIEPDEENHRKYEFYFDKYRRTYFALKDLMHEMSGKPVP
ncbi:MAG TPA: xylulose kinase [Spirochaetes bacterium]|nr:xylulose kinase [Spirochaetota bacterium]